MIAETPPTIDVRDDLERSVRALHDDAWRRHEDTKAELARIAQAASLLGVQLDMVRPFRATRASWAEIDVEPEPPADSHLRHLQGGIIPKPGQVLIGVDGPQVIIPLARHTIPAQVETVDRGGEPTVVHLTVDSDAPEIITRPQPEDLDDRARAVADTAGEILDPIHDATGGPRHECRWCDFHSTRKQAVGSHESSQHPKERAAEKARREHEASRPARAAAQMAEDLANYRGSVLACHDSECLWLVPVAKTGALDQLATHTLSEHGRAPSRRERTPQERP